MSRRWKKKAPAARSSAPISPSAASRPAGWSERRTVAGVCLFLAAITLAVFGRTLGNDFVNYDDDNYVYDNPVVSRGLTWAGFRWALTYGDIGHWHPLTWLSHMLDCQLYGLNPAGHHLSNVLLHTVAVVLLFVVLRRMTGNMWRSAFVAAVFAIHPLRVESVAWVAERKDVLSAVFFMLTLMAYVEYVRRPWSLVRYGLVVMVFALGLLSKNMLVTLPLVLLLLDYWPLKRVSGFSPRAWLGLVAEKIPLLVLTVGSCVATALVPEKLTADLRLPLGLRLENAVVSYVTYLWQMIHPVGLACLYPNPTKGLPVWEVAGAAGLLVALSGVAWACRRSEPWLLVGWLWYVGMLVPVIGIVQISHYAHADRYTYLPQIGLYVLLTWTVAEMSGGWRHRRVALGVAAGMIVAALMAGASIQTAYWRNSETLWTHTLGCTSDNAIAHYDLGEVLLQQGRVEDAIAQYQQALEIKPDYVEAYNNLGNALLQEGKVDEATAQYQMALQIKPDSAGAHYNLGSALFQKGRVDEAIAQYRMALEIDPDYAEAHNNLGNALVKKGNMDEAIAHFQMALQDNPDSAEAHNNLGGALLQKGKVDEAIAHFQRVLQIDPGFAGAHCNLGDALLQKGKVDEAITQYQRALQINPDSANAHYDLGGVLLQKGGVDEAIAHFQKALQINPDLANVHYDLGNALLQKGNMDEAIAHYQRALEINPDYAEAHINLGGALLQGGRVDEAIAHYQRALEINPAYAKAHNNLGNALLQKGNMDEAIAHFQMALRINPQYAEAHNNLGNALLRKGRVDEAIVHFQKALQIRPDYAEARNNLAWVLATCPQASLRNGNQAVELAERANQLTGDRNPIMLHTLAAAYAEAGRFPEAVATAQRALQLAGTQSNTALADSLRSQLKLYQAGLPFHLH